MYCVVWKLQRGGQGGGGWGVSRRLKKIKKSMKLNWNFQWGRVLVFEKIPSMMKGWISETTHRKLVALHMPSSRGSAIINCSLSRTFLSVKNI